MYNVTFYLRRLHSLAGLVCLGGFLLEHILTNARVLISPESFNSAVDLLASIPWYIMLPLEIGLVATPFLFHTIYGIYIAWQAKNNPQHYPYINNIQFYITPLLNALIRVGTQKEKELLFRAFIEDESETFSYKKSDKLSHCTKIEQNSTFILYKQTQICPRVSP